MTATTLGDYTGATAIYTAGQKLPETVNEDDVFVYGDYEYRYNKSPSYGYWHYAPTHYPGWFPRVLDTTKTEYGAIMESINNEPITWLYSTFTNCTLMEKSPDIPDSVMCMYSTYTNCYSLSTPPTLPGDVKQISSIFTNCTALSTAPIIPETVWNMDSVFQNCTALTTAPIIPNSVTTMNETFSGCTNLTTAPTIPNSVTNMERTFYECTALTTAPTIPSSVTNIQCTFCRCTSLSGNIEINANPTVYGGCFIGTSKAIILSGSSTILSELAATATNGNITVAE